MATYSFYEYSPPSTPPPEYWSIVEEKPPIPPKSARRTSICRSSYDSLMPTSCIPSVPARPFPLRAYSDEKHAAAAHRIVRKPLPLPPRDACPPPLSFAPLTPPPSLGSPSLAPTSPTPSLRSLASSASSISTAGAPPTPSSSTFRGAPSRYRHRGGPPPPSAAAPPPPGLPPVPRAVPATQPPLSPPLSPPPSPPRTLRHTSSAQPTNLRALRAMESEACLRAAYEGQLNAYLDGSIMLGAFGIGLGVVEE